MNWICRATIETIGRWRTTSPSARHVRAGLNMQPGSIACGTQPGLWIPRLNRGIGSGRRSLPVSTTLDRSRRLIPGPKIRFATVGDAALQHSSPVTRSWRGLAAIGLVGLAQAAALFLAVNLFWNPTDKNVQPPRFSEAADVVQRTAPSLDSEVDVEWGQVLLIRSEGPKVDITDLALLEPSNGEDPWYDFFNRVESASTYVAMTE